MTELDQHWRRLGLASSTSEPPEPEALAFDDDGTIPNSPLPVLIYRGRTGDRAALDALFAATRWPVQWAGGVFTFQHYHATAHEVLGVTGGEAQIQLGGESGETRTLGPGDCVIIPAGVGHCRLAGNREFGVVGGYPENQPDWDLCRADPAIHAWAQARVARVPLPPGDPVTGPNGPLDRLWRRS